jgi:ceramide glucosyltransferase
MNWSAVWKHQVRWARTIRVCQPIPYFFSILSNATVWPLVWGLVAPTAVGYATAFCFLRILGALDLQQKLTKDRSHFAYWWLVPVKDLLQVLIWAQAFAGNRIEWRGQKMRLRRDGRLEGEVKG